MKKIPIVLTAMLVAAAGTGADSEDQAALGEALAQLGIAQAVDAIPRAPVPGFLEIRRGPQVLYISVDGSTLIDGDILSIPTKTNLTEQRRSEIRREWLREIPEEDRLVFRPAVPVRSKLVVFTDTNCPYCKRFHAQRSELSRQGIEIQYLFYPRSGPSSQAWDQAVSVWCSPEPATALEQTLDGRVLEQSRCPNPVTSHYELARRLDLKGTPAIVTPDGGVLYGAVTVRQILDAAHLPDR